MATDLSASSKSRVEAYNRLGVLLSQSGNFSGRLGRAVQVDPIKPMLKAPGTILLALRCDEPLSNFAFNFNLRRYTWGATRQRWSSSGRTTETPKVRPGRHCSPRYRLPFDTRNERVPCALHDVVSNINPKP